MTSTFTRFKHYVLTLCLLVSMTAIFGQTVRILSNTTDPSGFLHGFYLPNLTPNGADNWLFESATLTERTNGTALLVGVIYQADNTARKFAVDVNLTGRSATPTPGLPFTTPNVRSTADWYYYGSFSGTLTGMGTIQGARVNIFPKNNLGFQFGTGGCLFEGNKAGGSTWFDSQIVTQPSGLTLRPVNPNGDIYFNMSAPIACSGSLSAKYYCNTTLTGTPVLVRNDARIDFDWGVGAPATGVTADNFSVSWTGTVVAPTSGVFTFTTTTDDGVRLYVNNQLIVNRWIAQAPTDASGTITLEAGKKYAIKMEYYEAGGGAVAKLSWAYPGQARQIVPSLFLCPEETNPCANDTQRPTFLNCPANISLTTTGTTAIAVYRNIVATDNCGTPTVTRTAGLASGSAFPIGVTTVTHTVRDAAGNTATCTFTVTVTKITDPCTDDRTRPVFANCPVNMSLTTSGTTAVANYTTPTATDNCSTPSVTRTAGLASGSAFPVGVTTVTYTARDAAGNSSFCSFTVTVVASNPCANDTQRPTFTNCPTSITLTTTSATAVANYTAPTATDNCGAPTITRTQGLASGSAFPVGVTTVTHTARDAAGNTAACAFTVTVNQTNPCINIDATKCYKIVAKHSGKAIQVVGGSTATGAGIEQKTYADEAYQIWKFTSVGNGYYTITVQHSKKVLTNYETSNGSILCQADYTGSAAQQWKLECVNGSFKIVHRLSGKVVDVAWASTNNGATIFIWDYVGGSNQLFNIEAVACPNNFTNTCNNPTGKVKREYWIASPNWSSPIVLPNTAPTGSDYLTNLCYTPTNLNWRENYYARVRAYLHVPVSGNYQFNVTGDDYVDFYISSDETPAKKTRVAYTCGWTGVDEMNKYRTQTSRLIYLEAGKKYYIETVHMEGCQGDFFVVRWKKPNTSNWEAIPGNVISEFCTSNGSQNADVKLATVTLDAQVQGNRTRLEWVNNSGDRNDYFVVEKMQEDGMFAEIETVNAKFEGETKYFTTFDNELNEGDNVYRIRLMLNTGAEVISENRNIQYVKVKNVSVYPNPADDYTDINLAEYEGQAVTIFVYNELGVQQLITQIDNANAQPVRLDLTEMKKGLYSIRIISEGKKDLVRKLVIMK